MKTVLFSLQACAFLLLPGPAWAQQADPAIAWRPTRVADLRGLPEECLIDLFKCGTLKEIPCGDLDGEMIFLNDRRGGFKVWAANRVWRGKYLGEDTYFSNRWICNRHWIGSHYVI